MNAAAEVRAALRSGALDLSDPEARRLVAKVLGHEMAAATSGEPVLLRKVNDRTYVYALDGYEVEVTHRVLKGPSES